MTPFRSTEAGVRTLSNATRIWWAHREGGMAPMPVPRPGTSNDAIGGLERVLKRTTAKRAVEKVAPDNLDLGDALKRRAPCGDQRSITVYEENLRWKHRVVWLRAS
jgi:hypothetical protein